MAPHSAGLPMAGDAALHAEAPATVAGGRPMTVTVSADGPGGVVSVQDVAVDDILRWLQTHAFRKRAAFATRPSADSYTARQLHRQQILDELKVHQVVEQLLQLLLMPLWLMVIKQLTMTELVGQQEIILIINTIMVEQEDLQHQE